MANGLLKKSSLLTLFSYSSGVIDISSSRSAIKSHVPPSCKCKFHRRKVYVQITHRAQISMKGSIYHEFETGLPAADVWEVYGTLLFGKLMPQLLPEVASKVELLEGDGGAGSVLLITFPPGTPGSETFKEKFIKVDNENYVKETIVTEGGLLDHGFQKYMVRIEIMGKEEKTSIIRSTIEYEVDHEHADTPPVFSTDGLATIAEAITKYIKEQKGSVEASK